MFCACNQQFCVHAHQLSQQQNQHVRQQHRISDIKSAHVGHHVLREEYLQSF